MSEKTVLITGFFDLLHSGHVAFIQNAAKYGNIIVSLGSDENYLRQKKRYPLNPENERKYMLESLKHIDQVHISRECGPLSFQDHLKEIKPDYFIINQDRDSHDKEKICIDNDVEYIIFEKKISQNFSRLGVSARKKLNKIPHRIDLAGGFFDQKKFNSVTPGSSVILNLEPMNLEPRSGMASSTRRVIQELFGMSLPANQPLEKISRQILAYENFDKEYVSGATDAYGLVYPRINKFSYNGSYHPNKIETLDHDETIKWIEGRVFLIHLGAREPSYNVFDGRELINKAMLQEYSNLADETWKSIMRRDFKGLLRAVSGTCAIQKKMIPGYIDSSIEKVVSKYNTHTTAAKLMGSGGKGYLAVISEVGPENSTSIAIRRG